MDSLIPFDALTRIGSIFYGLNNNLDLKSFRNDILSLGKIINTDNSDGILVEQFKMNEPKYGSQEYFVLSRTENDVVFFSIVSDSNLEYDEMLVICKSQAFLQNLTLIANTGGQILYLIEDTKWLIGLGKDVKYIGEYSISFYNSEYFLSED